MLQLNQYFDKMCLVNIEQYKRLIHLFVDNNIKKIYNTNQHNWGNKIFNLLLSCLSSIDKCKSLLKSFFSHILKMIKLLHL
jgi:uncharacterized protein YaaR (DUF327 family)